MCSRGTWQMRGLLFQYCKWGGSSRGVRQYLEEHLVDLAKANPQIEIAVSTRAGRHPFVRGFYLRDPEKTLSLRGLSASQIIERVSFLRDTRSINMLKHSKAFRTTPSIQGAWELGRHLDLPHRTLRA